MIRTSMTEEDRRLSEIVAKEGSRLRGFVRRKLRSEADVEDVLQDVFFRLVEANRLLVPIEHVTGWLFQVARNRIADLLRRKEPESLDGREPGDESLGVEDLLPTPESGPEADYARRRLLEELRRALEELPEEQRSVFVAHELEGKSFKELAAATGVNVNTLLARKRYAVLRLRERLRKIHDEFE
ncbi:MAG TPA: RNA polymerase sigma factor [Thermoanaerobaculia bacterium]|nr:RNA polymerase sigma factor [Thermoanaerobaculia bacterium]